MSLSTDLAGDTTSSGTTSYSNINSGQLFVGHSNVARVSISTHHPQEDIQTGIDIIRDASEPNAAVDAEARAYPPQCFPGTREQYIEDITKWASAGSDDWSPSIYWMYGPAGVGKSAIAQTCAESVKDSNHLGAAFFFSINGRRDHTRLFPTIAYQLATVLPEYRRNLNDAVLHDKTIVTKVMASQFKALIVEPLRGLKDIPRKAVFIDGLDECYSTDAQSDIIKLISTSVRDGTTPFRWAFFSRPEVHIEAALSHDYIQPLCTKVFLPISRDSDEEIQLYLEGEFKNIRRENLTISQPWPPPEVIQKLVDASAGLYAYPAAVLRFIGSSPSGDPKEALTAVLDVISRPHSQVAHLSPFAELDAFYMLIMQRIPGHLLPSIQLLFAQIFHVGEFIPSRVFVGIHLNRLGLSEAVLNGLRKYLHAVLYFPDPVMLSLPRANIDITRPYYEQRLPSEQVLSAVDPLVPTLGFHHRSFYEFLTDPARSADFCANTIGIRLKWLERTLQVHLDLVQGYIIRGSDVIFAPDVRDSASALSVPLSNEFCNSWVRDWTLMTTTPTIYHGLPDYFQNVPRYTLQKLSEADYRKSLLVGGRIFPRLLKVHTVDIRTCFDSEFRRLNLAYMQSFNFIGFISMVKHFKKHRIIELHHPSFTSRMKNILQTKESGSKRSGLYILGRGDKSVYWYWEFDMELKEYYEFRTLDLPKAMDIFQTYKHKMWNKDWTPPSP